MAAQAVIAKAVSDRFGKLDAVFVNAGVAPFGPLESWTEEAFDKAIADAKTKAAVAMLKRLGVDGKALLVDVKPEEKLSLSVRNIEGIRVLPSNRVSARDVANTRRVVLTRAAQHFEREGVDPTTQLRLVDLHRVAPPIRMGAADDDLGPLVRGERHAGLAVAVVSLWILLEVPLVILLRGPEVESIGRAHLGHDRAVSRCGQRSTVELARRLHGLALVVVGEIDGASILGTHVAPLAVQRGWIVHHPKFFQ